MPFTGNILEAENRAAGSVVQAKIERQLGVPCWPSFQKITRTVTSSLQRESQKHLNAATAGMKPLPQVGPRTRLEVLDDFLAGKSAKAQLLLLQDKCPSVRADAAWTLGQMEAAEYANELIPLLRAEDPEPTAVDETPPSVRTAAACALGNMQAAEYASELVPLLKVSCPRVRAGAAWALGNFGKKAAQYAKELVPLLHAEDPTPTDFDACPPSLRQVAASALGEMEAAEHAKELLPLLKDLNPFVRAAATRALGKMGENATEYVAELLPLVHAEEPIATEDDIFREFVNRGWPGCEGPPKPPSVRECAVWALGQMGQKVAQHAEQLLPLLQRDNRVLRGSAAWALGRMRAVQHAEHLLPLLSGEEKQVAIWALGEMQAVQYAANLAPLLRDDSADIRAEAVMAIGKMRGVAVNEILYLLENDVSPWVRLNALNAITKAWERDTDLAPEAILKALRRSQEKEFDENVRLAAARLINRFVNAATEGIGTMGLEEDQKSVFKDQRAEKRQSKKTPASLREIAGPSVDTLDEERSKYDLETAEGRRRYGQYLLTQSGRSQVEVSQTTGLSQPAISRILRGESVPRKSFLKHLELLFKPDSDVRLEGGLTQLRQEIARFPIENQHKVLDLVLELVRQLKKLLAKS